MDIRNAASFKIVDDDTGNSVASFDSFEETETALARMLEQHPDQADALVAVAMDEHGIPIGSWTASEAPQPA